MKLKKIAIIASTAILTFSLAACSSNKNTRNTTVPYGDLNLDSTIATALNNKYSMTNEFYYNRLRASGYDIVLDNIKKVLFVDELEALTNLVTHSKTDTYEGKDKVLATLSYTDSSIDQARYEEIYDIQVSAISSSIASSLFSSSSYSKYESLTNDEKDTYYTKFIEDKSRSGYSVKKEDLSFKENSVKDSFVFDLSKLSSDLLESYLIPRALNFYAQKELYKIADKQYIKDSDGKDVKNTNYLFKENTDDYSTYESKYNSTYKSLGDYKAIIITFNSRHEANRFMDGIEISSDKDEALRQYVELYNKYYSYKKDPITSSGVTYEVSLDNDELSDISSDIRSLIVDTLSESDTPYLTQPRNINNKYSLVYYISSEYTYGNVDFDDLNDSQKADIMSKVKNTLIQDNASSYESTSLAKALDKATDNKTPLEIYDPLFEYKFNNSYADNYDLINKNNSNVNSNLIFSLNGVNYTVNDFYNQATKKYGAQIVNNYFMQLYSLEYSNDLLDSDTADSNKKSLETEIKNFNNNKNSSYPKEVGLETYLTSAYGYTNKDDIIKFYYNAKSCLSSYLSKALFTQWADDNHNISDDAKKLFNEFLAVGNAKYSEIFNINLDHVLINIDYDSDGSPDDPDEFLKSLSDEKKAKFESDVTLLARAIYLESTYTVDNKSENNQDYSDNSLYENLAYIVKQFNKGSALLAQKEVAEILNGTDLQTDGTITWDTFKKNFNFLLTAEQLASNSDITQDTASNFVVPFKNYIVDMYKTASSDDVSVDKDKGNYYVVSTVNDEKVGSKLTKVEDASKITIDSLCKTVYGYHLIVMNSYSGPSSLIYKKDTDTNGYQAKIQLLLKEDKDNASNNIYVETNSYNENKAEEATLNQLFIYYVEKKNGKSSSLDSSIQKILGTLFDDIITLYSSSNFQNLILIDELNINVENEVLSSQVRLERNYYANLINDYGNKSQYSSWVDSDNHNIFQRPDYIKEA